MSVRFTRPSSRRPGVKKAAAGKKKTPLRQAWDSSVHDLGIHRATPEELVRRHEIHKSKNQSLAQWELKNKLLNREWRRQNGGTPDPLEDKRLALMMEILSDQYQMKDVLERSDRAMAVVKDLFGDAPRRHTGFPNVTMAPSCDLETSRFPIALKKDPPTRLSILSESIMDSQALNEVEEGQSNDDDEDDDVQVSISFQPSLHTDRFHQILNEESSPLASEPSSRPRHKMLNGENPLVTPKGAGHPPDGQIALNATTAVNKVKTRLTEEEQVEPESSSVIGRILNPQSIHRCKLQSKGKKKRPSHVASSQRAAPPATSTHELSQCNQSSLDILNQMIQEVERELETYERETGREVPTMPHPQGLTGFTLSLVSSIRRLVSYLKESDRQLRRESLERQQLKDELGEQRLLIDALTAEILTIKDGISLSPSSHRLESDQSQSSPGEATTTLPMSSPEHAKVPANTGSVVGFVTERGSQNVQERGAAPPSGYDTSSITQMTASFVDVGPVVDFQPAIMLSPPRQETRSHFGDQSSFLLGSHPTSSSSYGKDFRDAARCSDPAVQSWRLPSHTRRSPCVTAPQGDSFVGHQHTESQVPKSKGTSATVTNDHDIVSLMAELTCQNNALKAQLKQFSDKMGRAGDSMDASQLAPENKQEESSIQSPATLEMRIAELNRQSTEARDKLLRLIEEQKQNLGVSPAISPITPQLEEPGRRVRRIDAVLPMPQFTDSSVEETPSPGSGRRSSVSRKSNSSVTGSSGMDSLSRDGPPHHESWFALNGIQCWTSTKLLKSSG